MSNEIPAVTSVINALVRSRDRLTADEIREITNIVPEFANRYVDDYFKERSASRTRKNILTGAIVFLCLATGISLIVGALQANLPTKRSQALPRFYMPLTQRFIQESQMKQSTVAPHNRLFGGTEIPDHLLG